MTLNRRAVLPVIAAGTGAAVWPAAAQVTRLKPGKGANHSKDLQAAIDAAMSDGGVVQLAPGKYVASKLEIGKSITIEGVVGQTVIESPDGLPILRIAQCSDVVVRGVIFDGAEKPADAALQWAANVMANQVRGLVIENCGFTAGAESGLALLGCSGRVLASHFTSCQQTGVFALDSQGLEVSGNRVQDIGNNGIQIWTSEAHEDGSIVANNRVERIAAKDGGSGQNGNGINVYRAGNVLIANNRVSDCAFSGIRNNSGSNCQITANSISRTGEVAIYVEFAFQGAVVAANLIEDVAFGISVTNLDQGGRLATISSNVVRNCKGGTTEGVKPGGGIYAEADTSVSGNTVENAKDTGIALGWGKYSRNLSATGNLIRDCGTGITASLAEGAQDVLIGNNVISGSKVAAILGMDHLEPVTGDLGLAGVEVPERIVLNGNLVK